MIFKSGFESRERERESRSLTAGGSEFQVRGAAVLNDRLTNDVRRNGTHSSGTDDDRVLRVLVMINICRAQQSRCRCRATASQEY